MTERTLDEFIEELEALRCLVAECRSRMPPLTKRQADDIGMYLHRAVMLGRGEPIAEVLAPVTYDEPRGAHLSLVT